MVVASTASLQSAGTILQYQTGQWPAHPNDAGFKVALWDESDEFSMIDSFRGVVLPSCKAFSEFANVTSSNITFWPSTNSSFPNRMTTRLAERISWLADSVKRVFGVNLLVLRA